MGRTLAWHMARKVRNPHTGPGLGAPVPLHVGLRAVPGSLTPHDGVTLATAENPQTPTPPFFLQTGLGSPWGHGGYSDLNISPPEIHTDFRKGPMGRK